MKTRLTPIVGTRVRDLLASALLLLAASRADAGALSGIYEVIASASTVNLTAEGTIDWAHWGRTSATEFNHRADVAPQISNFTLVGQGPTLQFGDNFTGYSWTNGTPIARATRSTSGIFVNNEGSGFELSVPADTTVKTLKVYVGAYAAQMHFEASLSDGSAPMYVDESFQNASDGPNRAYVLSFAADSAGQSLTVRYWVINSGGGNVTLQAAALREGAPLVELVTPINGAIFHPSADGLEFRASTISPNTISTNQVRLLLNDEDVSTQLSFTGTAASRTVRFGQLAANHFYQGVIVAADNQGQRTTNRFVFDTFSYSGTVVVEVEDYNYSADGFTGGAFMDNPPANGYQDFFGLPEVDYHTTGAGQGPYRGGDTVVTADATDQLRPPWVTAGLLDYHVMDLQTGDWLNYTRTFPAGSYNLYLRYAALDDQVVQLDQVTGDASQPAQTLKSLGSINAIRTGNENSYRYAPMTDALGNPIVLPLSGRQTLRLTGVMVEPGLEGLRANFLLFAPTTGPATRLPTLDFASPAPDADDVSPDARVSLVILNGDTAVVPASIRLEVDHGDVTGAATITPTATGASINYQPPTLWAVNSVHSITLGFGDNASPPNLQTNEWSFTVANLPIIPAAWGTPPGSGRTNGFLLRMAKAPNDSDPAQFPNTVARAELQLSGGLMDPLTGQPFPNEAAGPNGDGTYVEPNALNYQQDGAPAGYFDGDTTFPGVDAGDPDFMASQASFHLELSAGLYRLGVRSDDGFLLTAGLSLTNATLELGRFDGDRGSGLPGGSTEFEFLVERSGVYAFRLIWYEGVGGADLELFSVDRSTLGTADVVRLLVNDPGNAQAVKAYQGRVGTPLPPLEAPVLVGPKVVSGMLNVTFVSQSGVTYTVQFRTTLAGAGWEDTTISVAGDGNVHTLDLPMTDVTGFYRLLAR